MIWVRRWGANHGGDYSVCRRTARSTPLELGQAMWQHLENIKEMLFKASTIEDENELDYYLFAASQSEMP
jgi:hypothetical protein